MTIEFQSSYNQTFDGLASSGSSVSWTNDDTIPGWFLFRQPAAAPAPITTYNADPGSATTGAFLSYGAADSSDRALGGLGSGGAYFGNPSPGSVAGWLALALSNASGEAITALQISFKGEQWRNGGNATAQTMVLEYGYGASFNLVSTWTEPGGSFNWTSPIATATGVPVDGNSAGLVSNVGGTLDLSTTPWGSGTTLWLRWVEKNDSGNDHGLAIDDLTITLPQQVITPEVAIQAIDAQAAEFGDGAILRISRTGPSDSALDVPITVVAGDGLATAADLADALPTVITIPAGASSVDLPVSVLDDNLDEGTETLRVQLAAPDGYSVSATSTSAEITIVDNDRITLISRVQGSGTVSSLVSESVTVRAVVVGDFQLSGELGGFFLQEETSDWDASTLTSEGLYVAYPLTGENVDVALGDRVLITGVVGERYGQTAITSIDAITVEAQERLIDTSRVDISDLLAQRSSSLDLEPYEGMWVRFPETLTVNGLYGQFRYGEVELSAGGLPLQPTNVMEPGPAAYAAEQATALRELVLDDGSNSSYRPASAATEAAAVRDELLRRGDTITSLEGVLAYDFGKYRLQPTEPLTFVSTNPRPDLPDAASTGQLRVASFNVLNTFSTLNAGGALTDTGLAPRGANTAAELERQLTKLTAALLGLQADVIGLMELENDADDATLASIMQRLNDALPIDSTRHYSYIPTGLIGSDAIKVGLIYNDKAVAPQGQTAILDTSAFVDPLESGTPRNRPALAQAFQQLSSGELLNIAVNHFKSKGADGAAGLDLDQMDGQSAFNATRTAAAGVLLDWINTGPTGNSDRDWVILGDLNAYAKEDPIQILEAAGYLNALPTFTAQPPSSYAFYNPVDMSGALDHVLISPSLVPQAVSALDWNINAAEGAFRDYNVDTNSNGKSSVVDFYSPDPYRTSDHDPVLLDLDLGRGDPAGVSFAHGVASGDPYADSVILWTRITPPTGFTGLIDVVWEASISPEFEDGSIVDSGVFITSAARDWTVKVEADGLAPDTTYHYRFRAGDQLSAVGKTNTLPAGDAPVRLAVFSCANYTADEAFLAYGRAAAIDAVNPYDALVVLGDYIYEYGPGGYADAESAATDRGFQPNRELISLDDYRERYAQYHTDMDLQALRAAAPMIAIWDDHETANNSWVDGAENHQSDSEGDWIARRDAALKAYYEWLPIREPLVRAGSDQGDVSTPLTQGYRSFNFGDVLSLHVLETRLTARDEQLAYPDAVAVQSRIGDILNNPAEVAAYAASLSIAAPTSPDSIPAFASALAPLVTRELVMATVQQAWADPSRDLIGDDQMAWLQQQMARSNAAWQVLGQQVLMQSMAVPAELLLNAGDPTLLDKYAAPLQKLATGTAFADLSDAEQALFAEAGKIPYNLDAWDGYGVERETILQSALQLGKRLISLAGDTHNAWAGVLDTMSGNGTNPAGTVVGVEIATPGVTAPGLEKYLPGADAYIRAFYPAVDGLDGLFTGYVNGLSYADLNRRGFLDLTITQQEVTASFEFVNGVNPASGLPQWATETLVATNDLRLSRQSDAEPLISWQPGWNELDLATGLAVDSNGDQILLDPADFSTLPRTGIRLADVSVLGSDFGNRIFAGVGSLVDAAAGSDELFNSDSQGDNLLIAGKGSDSLYLRATNDRIIGGTLFANAKSFNLSPFTALADGEQDRFLIDSSDPGTNGALQILDFEASVDNLLIDGAAASLSEWSEVRQQLEALNIVINAAPTPQNSPLVISLKSGVEIQRDLSSFALDPDEDTLELLKISGPDWINVNGTVLAATAPVGITEEELANTPLILAFTDGKAVSISFAARVTLNAPPSQLELGNVVASLAENTSTASRIKVADIIIADDALGSNIITLSGDDAVHFEVVNTELFLKAGTALDFESRNSYNLTVSATDPALAGSTPVASTFSLAISDVNEIPGSTSVTTEVSIKLPNGDDKVISIKINNADFVGGSNLSIISDLGIQESDLKRLGELNIQSSASGLDFSLSVREGESASVNAALELVAADLLPELSDSSGRRPDRKLLFYGVTGGGALTPLTYDPITGAGARFYDLDNDGIADFFALSLIDGGYGDKDGLVNGVIDDPSFAGFADLANLKFIDTGSGTVTIEDPSNASPAALSIRATLSGRANSSNQIGYVVLSADETADPTSLLKNLNSIEWLRTRALTLFSSLESSDVTLPADTSFHSDIQLINRQSIRFFEVTDSDLGEISSLDDSRFRYINPGAFDNQQVTFNSGSGIRFSLNFLAGDPGLNALVAQAQGKAPVLDLSAFTTDQSISGVMRFGREANFNSSIGFYRTLDAAGTVIAADGITRLRPDDLGYADAALQGMNRVGQISDVTVADDRTATRGFSSIAGGTFLAPFALVNGNTFFAYSQANVDKISHFRVLGNNTFGFEDTKFGGDRDYDDMVIAFGFTSVT